MIVIYTAETDPASLISIVDLLICLFI